MTTKIKRIPTGKADYLKCVARESYRMSYSGQRLVKFGVKKNVEEEYFVNQFPMQDVWDNAAATSQRFDAWHEEHVKKLSPLLKGQMQKAEYKEDAIAAKFLNTFLHQLMKFKQCQPLWRHLHLPLDGLVFDELKALAKESQALKPVAKLFDQVPYSIKLEDYKLIQKALMKYVNELNRQSAVKPKLTSRIEFNPILWAGK